jgi:hypothetical protein
VGDAEAIDLIGMLPDGSRWVAATHPERSWTPERQLVADVLDAIAPISWALALDREKVPEPIMVTRPRDLIERMRARERAQEAKRKLESETWEEM